MQRRIGILRRRRIARRNPEQGKRREPQDGARKTWHASSFRPRGPLTPSGVQITDRLPTPARTALARRRNRVYRGLFPHAAYAAAADKAWVDRGQFSPWRPRARAGIRRPPG